MDQPRPAYIPDALRYVDGQYTFEPFPRLGTVNSPRAKRIVTNVLRAVHRPWFAVWLPTGVAELTTIGRKSGKPRRTYVRAYRDRNKAYLVAIGGEHTLWLKNIRANPQIRLRFRRSTVEGFARDPRDDTEREAIRQAFCGKPHPFDYPENMFHRTGLPTRAKITELHQAWLDGGTALVVDAS